MSSTVVVTLIGILLLAVLLVLGLVLHMLRRGTLGPPAAAVGQGSGQESAVKPLEAAGTSSQPQPNLDEATSEAEQIRARATSEAAEIVSRAQASAEQAELNRRAAGDEIRSVKEEVAALRTDLERREARLAEREQRLDEDLRKLEERSASLGRVQGELDKERAGLDRLGEERREVLERTAGLTSAQAKAELVASIESQAKREAVLTVRDIETEARKEGNTRARKIVTLAIQRIASEQTSESVVSVLHLPGDEMKGRIIGREGRNIRAFESVTGVNLIIDDTPEAVLLSCFDPVRREVGRLTLERLVL
ncbi:MAG: Rnase Y domain-containing protein, partial [Streptosporangiaceae bacterium]